MEAKFHLSNEIKKPKSEVSTDLDKQYDDLFNSYANQIKQQTQQAIEARKRKEQAGSTN
jgi:hypothetical protein